MLTIIPWICRKILENTGQQLEEAAYTCLVDRSNANNHSEAICTH